VRVSLLDSILTKHSDLSALVAKIASENRAPTEEERSQLEALHAELKSIREGWEGEGRKRFLDSISAPPMRSGLVLKADQSLADVVKASADPEFENVSLAKILKGYVLGQWDGAELEQKAMASSPASAGGVLIPTVLSARIIDMARNMAAVLRAGAVTVPMTSNNLKMARQTQDVTAGWYSEAAAIDESDAAFDAVDFVARKMAALIRVNNELLEDAPNVNDVLMRSIAAAIALELDRVALLGSGTPPEPRGLYNVSATNKVATFGTPANYDKFLEALYQIRGYNYDPNAVVYSSRTAETLAKLKTGLASDNTPLVMPADWAAITKYVSNQIPNDQGTEPNNNRSFAVLGQWNQLAIGLRLGLQIEVSREAEDVFSKDQTLIRARWRGDVQVLQPKAFSVCEGITTG
jgi:HK97 family phage major capsid protein